MPNAGDYNEHYGFHRPSLTYAAYRISSQPSAQPDSVRGKITISPNGGLYNIYNALAALTVAGTGST